MSCAQDSGDILTYRLDIEYDGTDFSGWQQQPNARTVQECLERAVAELFGETLAVIGAGRTDAGVHASGQVAHFRTHRERSLKTVKQALNALLPDDIRIKDANFAQGDFHARFSACWRGYRYRIACQPMAIGKSYFWACPHPLDIDRMQLAIPYILGNRQFKSFAHAREEERHYLSTVYSARWRKTDQFYEFEIEANRFLHGMVRLLVGTFVDIGRGKIEPVRLTEILQAQDVRKAGPKAPARGLTLISVNYEPWKERAESDVKQEMVTRC
jgi:tRNA pseudouridine38-40 synthase